MQAAPQNTPDPGYICQLCTEVLSEMKAVDPLALQVGEMTSLTDYMMIATGTSSQHVRSIAEELKVTLKSKGIEILGIEGERAGEWVLLDAGDVVVHVMQAQTRAYYELEKLWSVEACSSV